MRRWSCWPRGRSSSCSWCARGPRCAETAGAEPRSRTALARRLRPSPHLQLLRQHPRARWRSTEATGGLVTWRRTSAPYDRFELGAVGVSRLEPGSGPGCRHEGCGGAQAAPEEARWPASCGTQRSSAAGRRCGPAALGSPWCRTGRWPIAPPRWRRARSRRSSGRAACVRRSLDGRSSLRWCGKQSAWRGAWAWARTAKTSSSGFSRTASVGRGHRSRHRQTSPSSAPQFPVDVLQRRLATAVFMEKDSK